MGVTAASTKGGQLKRTHREFDDNYLIGFYSGCDYVPLEFTWKDQYDCDVSAVFTATNKLYHKELMRHDGGIVKESKEFIPLFDWRQLEKVTVGTTQSPDGEMHESYGYCLNEGIGIALEGSVTPSNACKCKRCIPTHFSTKKPSERLTTRHTTIYRKDRFYWTPGNVTQNESAPNKLFTVGLQLNPRTCQFNGTDKCGNNVMTGKSYCKEHYVVVGGSNG